jgi:hypothetical protein
LLKYKVNYNWGLIWLESGHASFSVKLSNYKNKPVYHFSGVGATYTKYDWFFKVRDTFESYVDTSSFAPQKFFADIHEGGKSEKHTYLLSPAARKAYTIITRGKKAARVDTISMGLCTIDVLTAIYYARSIDYSKCRINDTVGISVLLDGKVFPLYVRYLGRDKITSEYLGTFNCVKFSPLLVEGSIFKKGERMRVWVTDDKNKLPIYIETDIIVGSVKVWLNAFSGLRYELSSKVN